MLRGKLTLLIGALTGWALLIAGMASPAQAVTSTRAAAQCTPVLTSVSSMDAVRTQDVTLTGTCLGTSPAQADGDLSYFRITDLSASPIWNGCHDGTGDNDSVGCAITSWTDTSITFAGYDGSYGGWSLSRGDDVAFMVWNAQTGAGPAFCQVTVGNPGRTACPSALPAQVAPSTAAARATGVTYTAQFKVPAAGLAGGRSQLTITAPGGTVLPTHINEAYDATQGTDLGGWGGGASSAAGSKVTWTVGTSVPGGDVLLLNIPGVTNPGAVSGRLQVTTTQPSSATSLPLTITAARPVASVAVAPAQPVIGGAADQYTVQFTASSTGAIIGGAGQITLTAPAGTVLPPVVSDAYNVTSGHDLGSWPDGQLNAAGNAGTWPEPDGILAGDVIDLTLDDVTNPAAGSYRFSVATSSDTAAKSATYQVLSPASVPRISGTVSYDDGGIPAPVVGSIVQACDGATCLEAAAPTDGNGDYSLYVPSSGPYTVTAFPPTSNAYGVGEGSATPAAVTVAGPNTVNVTLPALAALPAGVTFNGESGTVGSVYWGSPAPLSAPGCSGGVGIAAVTSLGEQTGLFAAQAGPLTEDPAGSGAYQTTVPALYPSHGTGTITTAVTCPAPTALEPSDGPAGGGTTVDISGSGLSSATGVSFGPVRATSFTVLSDSEIEAVAPPGSGSVPVSITTPGGTISGALATYTYLAISGASPSSGPGSGGTPVTITGSALSGAIAVYFGDAAAANVDIVSDTEIIATSPAGSGSVPITILTEDGGSNSPADALFTYPGAGSAARGLAPGTPDELGAVPAPALGGKVAAASREGGALHAIRTVNELTEGAHVMDEHAVDFCNASLGSALGTALQVGVSAAGVQLWSQWKDFVTVGATQGFLQAIFEGFLGAGGSPVNLSAAARVPYLSAGTILAWSGLLQATYGDAYLIRNHQKIASELDAAAPCIGDALFNAMTSVQNSYQSTLSAAQQFIVRIDPSGTVEDTNGNPISGATVTLLQSSNKLGPFTAPSSGSPVMDPSMNPETTDADGAFHWDVVAGYYRVEAAKAGCYAPGRKSQATASTPVFQIPPPKVGIVIVLQCAGEKKAARPTVSGLSLTRGPGNGGTKVDVTGTGYTATSAVKFGAAKAAGVTVLGPTDIQVTAPRGTGTVAVTVTTSGGTSAQTAKDRYTYIPAPAVTRISPTEGPAKGGTAVTITGRRFAAGDTVAFGRTAATSVTVVSPTRIVVKTPAGAGTAQVTVTNDDGTSRATSASAYAYVGKPVFSSAATLTVPRGKAFSFTAVAGGYPAPALTVSGHLPPGVTFTVGKRGTATLAGKPTKVGKYTVKLHAKNAHGTVTQALTITVRARP